MRGQKQQSTRSGHAWNGNSGHPPGRSEPGRSEQVDQRADRADAQESLRLVVSESRPVVVCGIEGVIQTAPGISVIAATSSGYDLMRVVRNRRPDIVLVATNLADVKTLPLLSDLHECAPDVLPIVLAETYARVSRDRLEQGGACAVVRTSTSPLTLIRCIEQVRDHGKFWANGAGAEPTAGGLTDREGDVLQCLASGHADDRIATDLSISVHTVRNHIQNIYRKTDIHCQRALVAWAWQNGFGRMP